jgi:phi LC3 family holin
MKNNILNNILNKINWKVRFANKLFWITFIPQVLLVIQLILALIGIKVN